MKDPSPFLDKEEELQNMTAKPPYGTFFGVSQKVFDSVWNSLTSPKGESVTYISMEIGADRDVYHPDTAFGKQGD